jgi:hypothetical protein
VKRPLLGRFGNRGIHSDDIRAHGRGKPFEQRATPWPVGRKKLLSGFDRSRHNPVACAQTRRQSAGNPKADDARNAAGNSRRESGGEV